MNHLLSLHLHSCFASVASGDKFLYREVPAADLAELFHPRGTLAFKAAYARLSPDNRRYFESALGCFGHPDRECHFVNEIADVPGWRVYYTADTTNYHAGLHSRAFMDHVDLTKTTEVLKALGWSETQPAAYKLASDAQQAIEEAQTLARRTDEGYVFPENDADKPRAAFQGGLSDELFNHPKVIEYMVEKTNDKGLVCCWGYLGNSNRRVALDKVLEAHLRETYEWSLGQIADWLCSREGRHMADSYECPDNCRDWHFSTVEEQDAEVDRANARFAQEDHS